ncbi:GNAT family N-acetyltransferase [Tumebacillus sp. ITR2]|uniref:GNAT family N-acetyltransferase n=1 Tax=Tumebacillus amylolyticus TaxID=2801339 RepID=A0ABS1JE52_9BACL|nr:GNAT family N-acetyltransferase [Tumebacillus amylolyticus]MBL0388567.1 GNAT family N-acetyltransferase [Tumebacillus amylolyticus]
MTFDIASERLTYAKLVPSDWELIRSIYTNPKLLQHISTLQSEAAIRNNFEKELAPWDITSPHWLTWTIREKASNQQVGVICIHTHNGEKRTAEVGFILLETSAGKGYATEALKRVMKFAVDTFRFEKFMAVCSEEHIASQRVLEKVGMTLDELVPDNTEIEGRMVNDCFYSMEVVGDYES